MFCENCGKELPNIAKFCDQCGNAVSKNLEKQECNNGDEVLYEVRPTYKFMYLAMTKSVGEIGSIVVVLMVFIYAYMRMFYTDRNYNWIWVVGIIYLLSIIIYITLDKKRYQHLVYTFYTDRVECKNDFLGSFENQIGYKNIREVNKRQTITQKFFNIGDIVFYSNATSIMGGMCMKNIENVDEVYNKVKEIINQ